MDIYLSSSIKKDIKDSASLACDLGLNLEISRLGKISLMNEKYDEFLNYYSDVLKNFPNKLTLHGFFSGLNVISKDKAIADISKKRFLQSLNAAKKLNAHTVVYHSGYDLTNKQEGYREKFVSSQICFWSDFVSDFEQSGIVAVLENTSEPDAKILHEIVSTIDSPYLKLCLDTGHVNVASDESVSQWIKTFGSYLYHTHMHNNDGIYDQHCALKEGTLDFVPIIELLKTSSVKSFVLEMFHEQRLIDSLELFE